MSRVHYQLVLFPVCHHLYNSLNTLLASFCSSGTVQPVKILLLAGSGPLIESRPCPVLPEFLGKVRGYRVDVLSGSRLIPFAACFRCIDLFQARSSHPAFADQLFHPLLVRCRPNTPGRSWGIPQGKLFVIDLSQQAVNPSKAKGIFDRLFICEGLPGELLFIMKQPGFSLCSMVLFKPGSPFGRIGEGQVSLHSLGHASAFLIF